MIVTFQGEEYDLMFEEQMVNLLDALLKCDQTIQNGDNPQVLPLYTQSDLMEAYDSGYSQARSEELNLKEKENEGTV